MTLKTFLYIIFSLNLVLWGTSCAKGDKESKAQKHEQGSKNPEQVQGQKSKTTPKAQVPKAPEQEQGTQKPAKDKDPQKTPGQTPSTRAPSTGTPPPGQTTPVPIQTAGDAKKVFVIKDETVRADIEKIPGEILKDFTLVNDINDLKAGGNVLIVTSTSGPRVFNDAGLAKLITDKKNEGYKVSVLALRRAGKEVDQEDYGLPAKHGVGLFRVIVGFTGELKDQIPSTKTDIDELKKHLLTP